MAGKGKQRTAGLLRQGDVLLVPLEKAPAFEELGAKDVKRVGGRLVLAEGEATGHAHAIEGDGARLVSLTMPRRWAPSVTTRYLVVSEPETLVHEEHDPIPVEPGVYEVRRQREYQPRQSVWVRD